nr:zinc finger, CCHC-type [Tanacetum cinerariifolium]
MDVTCDMKVVVPREKARFVAYKLEIPQELSRVHNTFHVSNLKKCYADKPLAVPLDGLHFNDKLYFMEEPVEIMDREVKQLKRSCIPIFKVRWNSRQGPEFTWEREDQFRKNTTPRPIFRCDPGCYASSKKFLVSNFTNYKMTDSRPVLEQYNELLDFKHTLKHLKKELTLVELGGYLRIEESLKVQDSDKPKGTNVAGPSVVNMVEHNNSSRYNDNKGVNVGKKANGSGTKGSMDGSSNSMKGQNMFNKSLQVYYITYVSKAYFVQDGDIAWWVDSGKRVHVCKDRCWLNIVNDNTASAFMSTSKLNDSILWHARLGHIHFKRIQDMYKDGLISAFDMNTERCKTCMLTKITKKSVQNVKRETKVLELIHSDLCDLYATLSLENKKYFVTFIDDASSKFDESSKRVIICLYVDDMLIFGTNQVQVNLTKEFLSSRFSMEDIGEADVILVVLEEVTEEVVQQPEPGLGKSKRNKTLKNFGPEFQLYLIERTKNEDIASWKKAINDEMYSIMGNNTWVLADIPPGCKPLSCKWIFKRKLKPNDSVSINFIIESNDAIFDENRFSSVLRPSLGILNGTEVLGGSVVLEEVTEEVVQQPE